MWASFATSSGHVDAGGLSLGGEIGGEDGFGHIASTVGRRERGGVGGVGAIMGRILAECCREAFLSDCRIRDRIFQKRMQGWADES